MISVPAITAAAEMMFPMRRTPVGPAVLVDKYEIVKPKCPACKGTFVSKYTRNAVWSSLVADSSNGSVALMCQCSACNVKWYDLQVWSRSVQSVTMGFDEHIAKQLEVQIHGKNCVTTIEFTKTKDSDEKECRVILYDTEIEELANMPVSERNGCLDRMLESKAKANEKAKVKSTFSLKKLFGCY